MDGVVRAGVDGLGNLAGAGADRPGSPEGLPCPASLWLPMSGKGVIRLDAKWPWR